VRQITLIQRMLLQPPLPSKAEIVYRKAPRNARFCAPPLFRARRQRLLPASCPCRLRAAHGCWGSPSRSGQPHISPRRGSTDGWPAAQELRSRYTLEGAVLLGFPRAGQFTKPHPNKTGSGGAPSGAEFPLRSRPLSASTSTSLRAWAHSGRTLKRSSAEDNILADQEVRQRAQGDTDQVGRQCRQVCLADQ